MAASAESKSPIKSQIQKKLTKIQNSQNSNDKILIYAF